MIFNQVNKNKGDVNNFLGGSKVGQFICGESGYVVIDGIRNNFGEWKCDVASGQMAGGRHTTVAKSLTVSMPHINGYSPLDVKKRYTFILKWCDKWGNVLLFSIVATVVELCPNDPGILVITAYPDGEIGIRVNEACKLAVKVV